MDDWEEEYYYEDKEDKDSSDNQVHCAVCGDLGYEPYDRQYVCIKCRKEMM